VSTFTFLLTFRRAYDVAGLTHGQALPPVVFQLSGNSRMAFSSVLSSTLGRNTLRHPYRRGRRLLASFEVRDSRSNGSRLPRHHHARDCVRKST